MDVAPVPVPGSGLPETGLPETGLPELLLQHLLDAIYVTDAEGIIRYLTPSLEAMLGYPREALLGRRAAEFVHPEDIPHATEAFRHDRVQPGATRCVEVRVRHKEGGWRTLEMHWKSVPATSAGTLLIVTARDVTERRLAEEALRRSEEQYRRFFEEDLTGDFVSTPAGRVIACNPAFARMLGFDSVEAVLATPSIEFFPDPRVRQAVIERLRREKVIKHLELELRRHDGRPVYVVENVVGTFDETGELVEIRGYLYDITEQRLLADERAQLLVRERTARAVAEAAERRAAFLAEVGNVLDASLDYRATLTSLARLVIPTLGDYCLIDEATEGGGSRRVAVAHVDPQAERVLHRDERNAPDADPSRHPVMQVLRSGKPILVAEVSDEVLDTIAHSAEHRTKLREIELTSFLIVPLPARGRILGALTLAASVSGRRYGTVDLELAEAVARRAALAVDNARLYGRAQQAARAREEVLTFVSHDLRNPLATILLNASALLEQMPEERLFTAEREQLEWIARSSEQMNRLIQDLLDITRIEAGRLPLRYSRVEVRQLLRETCLLHRPLAAGAGVSLEVAEVAADIVISVDRERVERVLANLVGNAIKFTPRGGWIRLAAAPANGQVRVEIRDNGVGIPPDERPHIFEQYWQGGRARQGPERGSGLGLTIARALVEAHGGTIGFESTVGEGSTFYFTLPDAPVALEGGAHQGNPDARG